MSSGSSEQIISILNGQGIEVKDYPEDGLEDIADPGFYFNSRIGNIEHWSLLCPYNAVMASHFSNTRGIIQDGFQSIFAFEDIDQLIDTMKNWTKHLMRYGVIQ